MNLDVFTLEAAKIGTMDLSDEIFSLTPRLDILHRVVRWQLAKRRSGMHKIKDRSEISRTGAKMYKQKGTGRARHSSAKVAQFRGGGKAHGPLVRSHAHDLSKKIRSLGLKHALSSKSLSSNILIVENFFLDKPKTKFLVSCFQKLGLSHALIVDGNVLNSNFCSAVSNIPNIDILPVHGINVYDILRCKTLVFSKSAIELLQERFK